MSFLKQLYTYHFFDMKRKTSLNFGILFFICIIMVFGFQNTDNDNIVLLEKVITTEFNRSDFIEIHKEAKFVSKAFPNFSCTISKAAKTSFGSSEVTIFKRCSLK